MGRSSSSSTRRRWAVALDRAALGGLAVGLILYVMPFWGDGRLRPAFWLTLFATILHTYTSHSSATREGP